MHRARISSLLWKITILFVICCCSFSANAKYGGGTGEPNDPYLIFTAEHMNAIGADSNDWDKHFKLMADIDLSGYTGTSFKIIGEYIGWKDPNNKPFKGTFDGNGHSISNFTYTSADTNYIGIFGYVRGENAGIKDLELINPYVDVGMGYYVGSLIGRLYNGTITCCYIKGGSVTGYSYLGGLVGYNVGTITDCYSTASVTGHLGVGSLVGWNLGAISNCNSTGGVTGYERVGGLVGWNHGTITNCYSTASVTGYLGVGSLVGWSSHFSTISKCYSGGNVSGLISVGGLVGYNSTESKITNCYSIAGVSGNYQVGGLVGRNYGTITNCYSTGNVVGYLPFIGGLVGAQEYGTVLCCFWDIQTSGQTSSGSGTGKTTDQMQELNTFLYWGACGNEGIWTIDDGHDYPRLAWQNLPGIPIEKNEPAYGGGSGTEADPYQIWTAEQFNTIGQVLCHWDKHFLLCADIDLSGYTGKSFNIIGSNWFYPFKGIFDGNGHTISNFTYTSTLLGNVGLFGYVDDPNAEIKNLGLIDPHVDVVASWDVGSLVGCLFNGIVTSCCVEGGSVTGIIEDVGGLVGGNFYGTINNCSSTASVSGVFDVGGLIGANEGTITNCCSGGSIWGETEVGGLVGDNIGNIRNCYSEAGVSGTAEVGGLVGDNGGPITNCYSTGSVSGNDEVGGLVGHGSSRRVTYSFWDIETSGQPESDGGTGLSTAEMQMMSTFTDAGWDFVGETVNGIEDIWFIPQQDYPRLSWEGMKVPMKLTPPILNCRSKGNWVKAHLTLPQGFNVADVDPDKPAVLHSFGFQSLPLHVFVNDNGQVEIVVAFERLALCSLAGDWPDELTVAGFLNDGNIFLGTSTVRIITPKIK